MALQIKSDIGIESFSIEGFQDGAFVISNDSDRQEKISISFPLKENAIFEGYTVSVYAFKNPHFSQSDLFELRFDEKTSNSGRVGYIFSLKALLDHENNIFNEHTFAFAYYAFEWLVEAEGYLKTNVPNKNDKLNLTDFYDEELILVVICDQLTNEINDYSFDDYLFSLFMYGYVFVTNQRETIKFNQSDFIKENFASNKVDYYKGRYTFRISAASRLIRDEIFPTTLIKKLISEQHYFLTHFHTLYQIIEILIGEVLKNEIHLKISDSLPGYAIKKKLSELATEGYRIARLFSDYSQISESLKNSMQSKIQTFFSSIIGDINIEDDTEFSSTKLPTLVYKYRNTLVHNYRIIHKDATKLEHYLLLLRDINDCFEIVIVELVRTFHKPS